ncbi:phenylacetate--CoA ligase family protein [Legionella feeleii]|uniref:Coenzyme F390 synthetase n=1 Tax=Legionella feeleii TaxID=453 RepID=A0A378ISW4_9GAMM|nr:phenylacetate--CoA ligase family protein [Legionella feeleii]STX37962.1 Coenzyme F390 synthetase [Legionella feeleii]
MSNLYASTLNKEIDAIQDLLPQLSSRLSWSKEEVKAEQQRALVALLAYAKQNSPYYASKFAHIEPSHFTLSDLAKLPVMTKKEAMTHWDEIVTDRKLTLERARQFLHNQIEPELLDNAYHFTATGGSSGVRGVFGWNIEEFILFVAAFFRFQYRDEFSSQKDNSPVLMAAITAAKPVHLSRFVFTIPLIPQMKVLLLPATMPITNMVEQLNIQKPSHLIGYTTEIYRLAQEAGRGKLKIFPRRVSVNSEPLFPDMLKTIKKAWNVPVTNMWGSSDAGPHAQSCDHTNHLHLNEDLIIFEAVDENNQPVPDGREATKVLVTNLFHKSMPLFRYEIDDRIRILADSCSCGSPLRLVQSIKGRNDDSFSYANGICVIPEVFENLIFPEEQVEEYQVFQTIQGAEIWLTARKNFVTEKMQKDLVTAYRQVGIENPVIEIKIVPQLKRHPETGKLKRFVKLES